MFSTRVEIPRAAITYCYMKVLFFPCPSPKSSAVDAAPAVAVEETGDSNPAPDLLVAETAPPDAPVDSE